MTRKSPLPQARRHILVYDEDWEFLASLYGPGGLQPSMGISPAIRAIIHKWVRNFKARQAEVPGTSQVRQPKLLEQEEEPVDVPS